MKKRTLTLVVAAAAVYYSILVLALTFLPPGLDPPVYFLVAPLIIPVLVIANDLSSRATLPRKTRTIPPVPGRLSREVEVLTRQIEVGVESSPDYFEKVLVERLRDVLTEKVALETGMDRARVREVLANPSLGPGLLRDRRLYNLLYSAASAKGPARVKMLDETTALVESWKP